MKTYPLAGLLLVGLAACTSPQAELPDAPAAAYDCEVSTAQVLEVDALVGAMHQISPWGDDTAADSILVLNGEIERTLSELLTCAAVETIDLESETFESLGYAQTPDGRLRNFYWYANNGGTWMEMRHFYQYYPEPQTARVRPMEQFTGSTEFYPLKGGDAKYLGFGADRVCSTCIVEYAELLSIEGDSLRSAAVLTLEARMGNIVLFEFDPATQTLSYVVIIDDLNADWAGTKSTQKLGDLGLALGDEYGDMMDAEVVSGVMVYSGTAFTEM